jgi:hypothetical protein
MKKTIFSVWIIMIMFLVISKSYSTCDPPPYSCDAGWVGYCFTFAYLCDDGITWCNVTVYYCFQETWTGSNWELSTYVSRLDVDPGCSHEVFQGDQDRLWITIRDKLLDDFSTHTQHIPPCDGPILTYWEMSITTCWKIHNAGLNSPASLVHCDGTSVQCITDYSICMDTNYWPPRLKKTLITSEGGYSNDCPEFSSCMYNPPAGKTWADDWFTCCFWICPNFR